MSGRNKIIYWVITIYLAIGMTAGENLISM